MSILELENVSHQFGQGRTALRALDNVSLAVDDGEIVIVMGPSGSGKTTMLQVMGALLTPTTGEVRIDGRALSDLDNRSLSQLRLRDIGFIFQSFNLLTALPAIENVALPAGLASTSRKDRLARASFLLQRLGLGDRMHHRPDQLSGGEQQRVAIARAMVNDPPLLLADEPTANLDATSGYHVLHLLEQIAREERKTIVMVTHDHRITDVADRLLWLADGALRDRENGFDTAADPVCGMELVIERAAGHRELGERSYHFCSEFCLSKFDNDPDRYADAPARQG